MRKVVVLPQPDGPMMATNSPLADFQVHLLDGNEVAKALHAPCRTRTSDLLMSPCFMVLACRP
jgi:hypothetical protein